MAFSRYAFPLLSAAVLSALSFNVFAQRRAASTQKAQLEAHTTILESLVGRFKAGERVTDGEIARLLKLAKGDEPKTLENEGDAVTEGGVAWKEVLLGKKMKEDAAAEAAARAEWEAGM